MEQRKLSELVMDDKLTEMRPVNIVFVSRYRQAYRAGAQLPAIIIDKESRRIISGNHRYTALLEEYGADHKIKVDAREFASERERLELFIRENVAHGNPLDGISRKRLTIALAGAGATPEEIATIFNVTVKRVAAWGEHGAFVTMGGKKTKLVPLKRGVDLTEGTTITPEQYKQHIAADLGLKPVTLATQLTRWLNNGWVAITDENLAAIDQLRNAIDLWLPVEKENAVS